jgi:rhamnosyltransferase
MDFRVAAYITGYEDITALSKCVAAIAGQSYKVEKIHIVENSKVSYKKNLSWHKIVFEHHPENIGISGGLRASILWATENNYDFLWTFDQDSEPVADCLEKLLLYYKVLTDEDRKVGVLGPTVIDCHTNQKLHGISFNGHKFVDAEDCEKDVEYYSCDAVITSGSLISLQAARDVPLPHRDLFIDAVDWEYCLQFRNKNLSIFVVRDAILKHRFGESEISQAILKKREITIYYYSPLRYFYMYRNHTYIESRLSVRYGKLLFCIRSRLFSLGIMTVKIIFYERKQVVAKLWACYSGTVQGFLGFLGKTW